MQNGRHGVNNVTFLYPIFVQNIFLLKEVLIDVLTFHFKISGLSEGNDSPKVRKGSSAVFYLQATVQILSGLCLPKSVSVHPSFICINFNLI